MATTSENLLFHRTFCLITGASRGLGRGLAVKFAEKLKAGSLMLLLARDLKNLKETKELITGQFPGVSISCESVDLGKPDPVLFENLIAKVLADNKASSTDFEQAVIIHNAGTLGDITKTTVKMDDVDEFRAYFDLNVNSPLCLNTKFLAAFPENQIKRRLIINISSLAAFHPFRSWGQYCTGKAARDMLFRVMAEEDKSLRILNYAPGPLQTEMTVKARESSADADVRQWFIDAYAEGKMLPVEFTADRLIEVLQSDKYKSGDHVDVYDEVNNEKRGMTSP